MTHLAHPPSHLTPYALLLALLVACTPPAPTPQPIPLPTAALPTETPTPTAAPTTPPPTATPTPQPTPAETREAMGIEPVPAVTLPPRLGVANANGGGVVLCDGREFQSQWSSGYVASPCFEHIPMLANKPGNLETWKVINTAGRMSHHYWLVYNECEHESQCAATPQDAARYYHDVLLPFIGGLDPNALLIIGGSNAGQCGLAWMADFVEYYEATYGEEIPRAGFHFHPYPEIWAGHQCEKTWEWDWARSSSLSDLWDAWQAQALGAKAFVLTYGREGDEIWFSELGCLSPPPSVCHSDSAALAGLIVEWLNGEGLYVNRATWYSDWDQNYWKYTHLYAVKPGEDETSWQLRPAGEVWLNAELLAVVPLEFHRLYFPIVGYVADVVPPVPAPAATPTPPAYPVPGDLHP